MVKLQRVVQQFTSEHGLESSVAARLLDLAAEVGELAKEGLKGSDYGKQPFQQSEAWQDELGDVVFTLICLANSTDVDLEAALHGVLEKYRQRINAHGEAGSGR